MDLMTAVEPYAAPLPAQLDAGDSARLVMAWLLAQESDHTRIAYRRDIAGDAPGMKVAGWLVWCESQGIEPLEIRRAHVDAHKEALRQAGYSANTVARRLAAISSFYQYATDEEVIPYNPAKAVKRPKIDTKASNAVGLSEAELDALIDEAHADSARSGAIVETLYYTGVRVGTLIAADIGDLGWYEGERILRTVEKGVASARTRFLTEIAGESIDRYIAERGKPAAAEPLFVTDSGDRIDQPFVWRLIRRLAKRTGIKSWDKLGPHSLRHTYATHALDHEVPLADVQDGMGHADPKTTRRYDEARQQRGATAGRVLVEQRRLRLEKRQRASSGSASAEPLPHERLEP